MVKGKSKTFREMATNDGVYEFKLNKMKTKSRNESVFIHIYQTK